MLKDDIIIDDDVILHTVAASLLSQIKKLEIKYKLRNDISALEALPQVMITLATTGILETESQIQLLQLLSILRESVILGHFDTLNDSDNGHEPSKIKYNS